MTNVQNIGRYELLRQLAVGGMGRVWLARTVGTANFERHVVIKTLDTAPDESFETMFLDEARVLGRMHHQHIAPLFELDRAEDGSYFLVMEYVHGHNAQEVWDRAIEMNAALPLDFALTVAAAAASALHYAHTRKSRDGGALDVVHRDVSLANLMIGFDGAVKLIDFGIAKAVDRSTLTQTGYIKGKLGCMAPEQVNGSVIDHRTDIFALGIALYELTTMTRTFRVASDLKTLERIRKGDFIAPSTIVPGYPRGLELIIMKALRIDRDQRFQDADSMRREIEAFGHRQKLVMGDSAVVEVMAQLFDNVEPWHEPPEASVHAIPAEVSNHATVPHETGSRTIVRNLRAATELADQMVIEVHSRPEEDYPPPADLSEIDPPTVREGDPTAPLRQSRPMAAQVPPPTPPSRKSQPMAAQPPPPPPPLRKSQPIAAIPPPTPRPLTAQPAVPVSAVRERLADSEGDWKGETVYKVPKPKPTKTVLTRPRAGKFSKRGAIESAMVLAMVAVIVGVIHLAASDAAPPVAAAKPAAAPAAPQATAPAPAVAPAVAARPAPHPPATPPPAPPPAPTAIHIKITTNPSDATVILDGQRLGHTPYEGTVPSAGGTHALKIRRRGYASLKLDVELGKDLEKDLTLQVAPGS